VQLSIVGAKPGTTGPGSTILLARLQDPRVQRFLASKGLKADAAIGEQGYLLFSDKSHLIVAANTGQGVFYGVQTLRQLLRSEGKDLICSGSCDSRLALACSGRVLGTRAVCSAILAMLQQSRNWQRLRTSRRQSSASLTACMFSDRTDWKLAPNRFTQALGEVRASGAKILDLTASNPTRVGLRYDEQAILDALASPRSIDYDPQSKGLRKAREAVAAYYRDAYDVRGLNPEQLILTTSTSEGYSYVFRLLCNPGDELLVPKPSYPLFEFLPSLKM